MKTITTILDPAISKLKSIQIDNLKGQVENLELIIQMKDDEIEMLKRELSKTK